MGVWPFDFAAEVAAILRAIPPGRVATAAAVAEALGDPLARPAVEEFLHGAPPDLPVHRVVDALGRPLRPYLAFRLAAEGLGIAGGRVEARPSPIPWPRAPLARLRAEQEAHAARALLRDDFDGTRGVAGADATYRGGVARGAAVLLGPGGRPAATSVAHLPAPFPYIPTYLAYRELPVLAAALEPLRPSIGLLLVEGHGALHPRGAGLATSLGVLLDLPTVGVAKGPLGFPAVTPLAPGEARPIERGGRVAGYALGVPGRRRPLYVSPGHRVSAATALRIAAVHCKSRLPEPLRLADAAARGG